MSRQSKKQKLEQKVENAIAECPYKTVENLFSLLEMSYSQKFPISTHANISILNKTADAIKKVVDLHGEENYYYTIPVWLRIPDAGLDTMYYMTLFLDFRSLLNFARSCKAFYRYATKRLAEVRIKLMPFARKQNVAGFNERYLGGSRYNRSIGYSRVDCWRSKVDNNWEQVICPECRCGNFEIVEDPEESHTPSDFAVWPRIMAHPFCLKCFPYKRSERIDQQITHPMIIQHRQSLRIIMIAETDPDSEYKKYDLCDTVFYEAKIFFGECTPGIERNPSSPWSAMSNFFNVKA